MKGLLGLTYGFLCGVPMNIVVREFNSIGEFIKAVDDDLSAMRKLLGDLLRRLEELRVRVEQERKLKTVLSKMGMGKESVTPANVIEMKSVKLVMNPTAEQEVAALEQAVESLNNKITQLQATRKDLEVLGGIDVEVKVVAVYVEGLPKTVLIRVM